VSTWQKAVVELLVLADWQYDSLSGNYYCYYYYYYYYYYYVDLVPARVTTVLHCSLSCMQACISSSCSPVSLVRVSMKVPVGCPLPLLPLSGTYSTRFEAASSGCLAQWPASFSLLVRILVEIFGRPPYSSSFVTCSLQLMFSAYLSILVQQPSSSCSCFLLRLHISQPYIVEQLPPLMSVILFSRFCLGLTSRSCPFHCMLSMPLINQ